MSLPSSVLELPIIRRWQFIPMVWVRYSRRFLIVLFMMNKNMDQKPEVNIVIRVYFVKQGIDKMP